MLTTDLITLLLIFGLASIAIYLYAKNRNLNATLLSTKEKYKDVSDAEEYIKKLKSDFDLSMQQKEIEIRDEKIRIIKLQEDAKIEAATVIKNKEQQIKNITEQFILKKNGHEIEIQELLRKTKDLQAEYKIKLELLEKLKSEISLIEEENELLSYGLYKPHFDFDTSEKYKLALTEIRTKEKDLTKQERAAHSNTTWTVNGSVSEGRKQTKHYMKLMLRAFNGECEALIADVRWNNISKMEDRLRKAFEGINKLGETHHISITEEYSQLKLNELYLTHEYQLKMQFEKDEQRRIQEQIREEQRTQKEIEKSLKETEDEEKRYAKALEQARKEMEKSQGAHIDEIKIKIQNLEQELEKARQQKQRALSMAQQTKIGHVYVISNIGSFGENIYKIGMSRRLDPLDRVRELGGASVPFEFDVHAMLFSEDAPALEKTLHREFHQNRVNMINNRKEFFNVSLHDIENIAKKYHIDIEFIKIPEAREYRESIALRKNLATTQPAMQINIEKPLELI